MVLRLAGTLALPENYKDDASTRAEKMERASWALLIRLTTAMAATTISLRKEHHD